MESYGMYSLLPGLFHSTLCLPQSWIKQGDKWPSTLQNVPQFLHGGNELGSELFPPASSRWSLELCCKDPLWLFFLERWVLLMTRCFFPPPPPPPSYFSSFSSSSPSPSPSSSSKISYPMSFSSILYLSEDLPPKLCYLIKQPGSHLDSFSFFRIHANIIS